MKSKHNSNIKIQDNGFNMIDKIKILLKSNKMCYGIYLLNTNIMSKFKRFNITNSWKIATNKISLSANESLCILG